ncbi:MAG: hypothetical protein HC853_10325 [Anaerolineae bacterium]|nr:hypothetical protein [Anaerolineae bacterium]
MSVVVESDLEILREAYAVLLKHLGASKTARFWLAWQVGSGDYLNLREQLFGGQTVNELYGQIAEFQEKLPLSK